MGKPSKLTGRGQQSTRVLYDRDKMPEGLDPEIWHLTLFFEQVGESVGASTTGRPIIYTELSNRINASNVRVNFIHWPGIIEDMIDRYWWHECDPNNSRYAINDFCRIDVFDSLLRWVSETRERQLLIDSGTRVTQPDPDLHESRRSEEDSIASEIINKKYTEDELRAIMERFKSERRSSIS